MDDHDRELARRWGRRIQARRDEMCLSQAALARQIGVHQATISAWELGRQLPRHNQMVRIAAALGVAPTDLFAYEEEGVA